MPFSDLSKENTQLKNTQRELLEKLEVQQKDFDTKQTVSGDHVKFKCFLCLHMNATKSKGSWSQLIHVMAKVFIDFLDSLKVQRYIRKGKQKHHCDTNQTGTVRDKTLGQD